MKYTIVVNMPGYLPESEPIELEITELEDTGGHEAEQVLEAIWDEVDRIAPEDGYEAWEHLLDCIRTDIECAADFDPRGGFLYQLPDGYVIEATYHE